MIKIQKINVKYVDIEIFIFYSRLVFTDENPLNFSISEKFKMENRSKGALDKFLRDTFLLDGNKCFFRYFTNQEESENFSGTLFGEKYICNIKYNPELNQIYVDELKPRNLNQNIFGSVILISGKINFVDGVTSLTDAAKKIYEQESSEHKEFEEIWMAYNEATMVVAREEVNRIGFRKYFDVKYNPLRLKFSTEFAVYDNAEFLTSDLGYAVCDTKTFEDARKALGATAAPCDIVSNIYQSTIIGSKLEKVSDKNEFRANYEVSNIPAEGYVFAPISGTATMFNRRHNAYENIKNFRNPLPTLKTLIVGGKSIVQNSARPHKAVNFKLSEKVFGRRRQLFTERQKEAIDVAINTPDIAIIQGPPGTGKTTVIKAIVERLNDIYKNSQLKILIASTQHDAVDNAIENMECGGMPPYRLGGKVNSDSTNLYYLENWFQKINEVCANFLEKDTDTKNHLAIRNIYSRIGVLRNLDVEENFSDCEKQLGELYSELQKLKDFPSDKLKEIEKITLRIIDFETKDNDDGDLMLEKLLDSQRTNPISFSDDGIKNLRSLEFYLSMSEIDFEIPETWSALKNFKSAEDIPAELFIKFEDELKLLREKVFGKTVSDEPELIQKDFITVMDLIKRAVDLYGQTFSRNIYDVLYEFQGKFQSPNVIDNLIAKYTKIIAATCQQSVARIYTSNKFLEDKLKRVYDYVIIDEAARSNPLDLLIPMSLGRFIILVGDQKQLPPTLEEDVVKKTFDEKNLSREELNYKRKILEEPLFQRLYNNLLSGMDAKRVVMLRDQYRMHPLIGKFVSDNFYEGQLRSPNSEEMAKMKSHNLGMYNNSAIAWINVGKNFGSEETTSQYSKSRKAEIDCVCDEVEKILSLNDNYTIGVITFYKLQAERLKRYFEDLPYNQKIRCQVGTVDAFQGKEFDIVILSTVRCNDNKDIRSRTGFVSSMNRLCVAFSRSKRLLVVVGDSETIARKGNKEFIKPFANFYDLCEKEGYIEEY